MSKFNKEYFKSEFSLIMEQFIVGAICIGAFVTGLFTYQKYGGDFIWTLISYALGIGGAMAFCLHRFNLKERQEGAGFITILFGDIKLSRSLLNRLVKYVNTLALLIYWGMFFYAFTTPLLGIEVVAIGGAIGVLLIRVFLETIVSFVQIAENTTKLVEKT